jgi:hypothetical protein
MLHARIATLHMEIPDPPLAEPAPTAQQVIALAKTLRMSGLLKADWNPAKHPRWPAGSPDSIGGQFASIGSGNSADTPAETGRPPVIPAQISIPFPFGSAVFRPIPWPSEIVPPAGIIPDVNPRRELTNPYPDRPECEEEWREAIAYCQELARKGFGWDGYRGMGKNFRECVMGQVSAGCGGNPTT